LPADPPAGDLPVVRAAAARCTACPLYLDTTQTVFGEGPPDARWMLVGEQPGDREDREGHPFVGPAGKLLDACLEEAGLDRATGWLTNAVKHFKHKQSGKRRLHDRPRTTEVAACKPWVLREIELVRPEVLVCLGATAAKALIDPKFSVATGRGVAVESALAPFVMATVHPSSLLRSRQWDEAAYTADRERFVEDLRQIGRRLAERGVADRRRAG
jgi:DNA polymerase